MSTQAPNIDLNENAIQDEEGTSYDLGELLEAVVEQKDIILTIPNDQVDELKKGLSAKKAKDNAKLKNAGLAPSKEALTFLVYEEGEDKKNGTIHVRVKLGPRTTINVLKMEIPDNEL